MRAINVEVSEVLKKLDLSANIDFLQICGWNVSPKRLHVNLHVHWQIYIYISFTFTLLFFKYFLQNVIWLNTRTGLRYKRHILHAPKYDE